MGALWCVTLAVVDDASFRRLGRVAVIVAAEADGCRCTSLRARRALIPIESFAMSVGVRYLPTKCVGQLVRIVLCCVLIAGRSKRRTIFA